MGEGNRADLQVRFDGRIRLQFQGAKVTSDGGLLAVRELDEALGLTELAGLTLADTRTGCNVQHDQVALLRQSVYSRLAGYEDTNDAERLAVDPAMRAVVGRRSEKPVASTNTLSRFETDTLTRRENLEALAQLNGMWADRAMGHTRSWYIILDLDSSESPVHGEQEGADYNGYFKSICYHPLFCFNHLGDCEGALLRPGHVPSAENWRAVLVPIVRRYRDSGLRKHLRADGAFACPEVYQYLEQEGFGYAIRLPENPVLQRQLEPLVTRPADWGQGQTIVQYYDLHYQAASWQRPRRVIAKVRWHRAQLLPQASFVVTNLGTKAQQVVEFYNGRGTAEQWIKEGKYALHWTRLSCHRFVANQVRLALFVLAYNLGNFLRRLALPGSVRHWSLRSIQVKLIKIGAKVVRHARQVIFQMAEVAVSKQLFEQILERIWALAPGAG